MPIRFYGDDDHTGDGIVKPSTYARPARTSNAHGHAPRWVSAAPKFSNNGTTTGGIYKKKRRVQRKKKGGKK